MFGSEQQCNYQLVLENPGWMSSQGFGQLIDWKLLTRLVCLDGYASVGFALVVEYALSTSPGRRGRIHRFSTAP